MRPERRELKERVALESAVVYAQLSEDPHVKVGCVVLRPDMTVAAAGYNGPPAGIDIDWTDREQRRRYVVHAEQNALLRVLPNQVRGGLLATTHHPCGACLPLVAVCGLRVVYLHDLDPSTYPPEVLADIKTMLGIKIRKVSA